MSFLPTSYFLQQLSKKEQEEFRACRTRIALQKLLKKYPEAPITSHMAWREVQSHRLTSVIPFPIGNRFGRLLHEARLIDEGERRPQFFLSLCSLSSLLLRYLAAVSIQLYVELSDTSLMEFNRDVVKIIQKATDNQWRGIIQNITNKIKSLSKNAASFDDKKRAQLDLLKTIKNLLGAKHDAFQDSEIASNELVYFSNSGKEKAIKNNMDLLSYLVYFRNKLIHAEPVTTKRERGAFIALLSIMSNLEPIWNFTLCVRVDNKDWNLSRIMPKEDSFGIELENKQIILLQEKKTTSEENQYQSILTLSPLLCIPQNLSEDEDIEDLFFINVGILKNLTYLGFQRAEHRGGEALGTYEQFKKYMASIPVPPMVEETEIDFTDYAQDKAKNFVGRTEVFEEIQEQLQGTTNYIVLKALAGMGKTAIMAKLFQEYHESKEWVFHFCMNSLGSSFY